MSFLADPEATHPAYIRKSFFNGRCTNVPAMAADAFKHGNAARLLLVKGATDHIVENGKVLYTVNEPDVPEMESIGGTGDTITGMVSAFISAGLEPHAAAVISCRANRTAGKYAGAKPDTRISEIIRQFKPVFRDNLCAWSGVCTMPKGEEND
jgi:NAD(P)H-hydrate repair Nnr-like enzyme with NAD(P)H-hydrate dehydratase domain